MSLYQKYRPKDFSSLVWQESVKKILTNSIKNNEVSHAYIFSGSRWTWKTSTARILAKALNSEVSENWEIVENDATKAIESWDFVDLIEIDWASNSWVENVRELQSKIWFSPSFSKKKIYIIDEVHMLSKWAFNALLKTIEEPPEFVYFILATTEKNKIPETIISRCINLNFQNIEDWEIEKRLEFICNSENIEFEKKALELIAIEAKWWLRDAISILEKLNAEWKITEEEVVKNLWIWWNKKIEKLFQNILDWDKNWALEIVEEMEKNWESVEIFMKNFLENMRIQMKKNLENKENLEKIFFIIENFQKNFSEIRNFSDKFMSLEIAVLKSFW